MASEQVCRRRPYFWVLEEQNRTAMMTLGIFVLITGRWARTPYALLENVGTVRVLLRRHLVFAS